MAEHKVTINWLPGTQLVCRKPITRITVSCFHPKWWQKMLFGFCDSCGEIPPMSPPPCREMFVFDESACRHARLSVNRLPSYHTRERNDRLLYPEATPCGCAPPRPEPEP